MDIRLKVEPQVLQSKSTEMMAEKNLVNTIMEEAKSEVNSLQGIWQSEASSEYQNRFKQVYDDIENVLTLVQNHITALTETAGIYITAEQTAKTQTEGLPTDGVFR